MFVKIVIHFQKMLPMVLALCMLSYRTEAIDCTWIRAAFCLFSCECVCFRCAYFVFVAFGCLRLSSDASPRMDPGSCLASHCICSLCRSGPIEESLVAPTIARQPFLGFNFPVVVRVIHRRGGVINFARPSLGKGPYGLTMLAGFSSTPWIGAPVG